MKVSSIVNHGHTPFTGEIGLATVSSKGELKEMLYAVECKDDPINPQVIVYSIEMPCTITKKIEEGETIQLFYKGSKMVDWRPSTVDEGAVGKAPIYYLHIDKATKFDYSDATKVIKVSTLAGVSATVKDSQGGDVTKGVEISDNGANVTITIKTADLEDGIYSINLQKGEYKYSFKFAK